MNKQIFNNIIRAKPKTREEKYIITNASKELSDNIIQAGFRALPILENEDGYFDIEMFGEYIDGIIGTGTDISDFVFLLCADTKKRNDKMQEILKRNGLSYRQGWRLFKNREYLENPKYETELKKILEEYIGRFEPKTTELNELETDTVRSYLISKQDTKGNPKVVQCCRNWETVLEKDKRLAGKVRFDEFSQQIYLYGDTPWETKNNLRTWGGHDDAELFSLIQAEFGLNSRNDYFDALNNISHRNAFHQVRDYLDGLKWDGKEHIRHFLPDYLGVKDTPYTHEGMKLMLLGGVARVYEPSCKFDYTAILRGRQGIGKSTAIRLLALNDNWYCDSLDSLDSTTAVQTIQGSWLIELSELKSLGRTSGGMDSVKRFLTATADKMRMPYQRRAEIFPRQCIFFGTTNKVDFIDDLTGARRFLIFECGEISPTKNLFDKSALDEIKQVWAQAVHIYKEEKPMLVLPKEVTEEAQRLQQNATVDDGRIGLIEGYLENKDRVCVLEIWRNCLKKDGTPRKFESTEINSIIMSLGWERIPNPTNFGEHGKQRGFQRKVEQSTEQSTGTNSGTIVENEVDTTGSDWNISSDNPFE